MFPPPIHQKDAESTSGDIFWKIIIDNGLKDKIEYINCYILSEDDYIALENNVIDYSQFEGNITEIGMLSLPIEKCIYLKTTPLNIQNSLNYLIDMNYWLFREAIYYIKDSEDSYTFFTVWREVPGLPRILN